jgi:hypothetical protein
VLASLCVVMIATLEASRAQEGEVPVDVQFQLLLKVLTFNRALSARSGRYYTIGVVYQKKYRPSNDLFNELVELGAGGGGAVPTAGAYPCKIQPIEVSDDIDLHAVVRQTQVDLIFLAPLRGIDVADIVQLASEEKILTTSANSMDVESGICIGIGQASGKPRILINLSATRASGADFSSKLLKISTVIQ